MSKIAKSEVKDEEKKSEPTWTLKIGVFMRSWRVVIVHVPSGLEFITMKENRDRGAVLSEIDEVQKRLGIEDEHVNRKFAGDE